MSFLMNMMLEASSSLDGTWYMKLVKWLKQFVVPVLIVVAAVGAFYAIYVGVRMAIAEDASKRKEEQQKLIYILIALAVTIVIVIILFSLPTVIESIIGDPDNENIFGDETTNTAFKMAVSTFLRL